MSFFSTVPPPKPNEATGMAAAVGGLLEGIDTNCAPVDPIPIPIDLPSKKYDTGKLAFVIKNVFSPEVGNGARVQSPIRC